MNMQTMIELPDAVYRQGQRIARAKGVTLEQLIVHVIEREVSRQIGIASHDGEVRLPLIRSKHPGTLDLSNFDFDDLLA